MGILLIKVEEDSRRGDPNIIIAAAHENILRCYESKIAQWIKTTCESSEWKI